MPRGKEISKEETIKILDIKLKSKSLKDISKILNRSLKSVYRVLQNSDELSGKKRPS